MAYEWLAGSSGTTEIQEEERPTRLAVTLAGLIGRNGGGEILIVNPHPDTWNNWQFPYASVQKELSDPVAASTFGDIEAALDTAADPAAPEVAERASQEIGELVGLPLTYLESHPALETYALRFSKSASVWTAYRFAYLAAKIPDGEVAIQHRWIGLSEEAANAADVGQLDGLPFSDNVREILRTPDMRSAVANALNEVPRG